MPHVLITGTTSGIGLGLAEFYLMKGWRVSAVNRREVTQFLPATGEYRTYTADVRDFPAVMKLVKDLGERRHDFPDLWLLTAGINKPDVVDPTAFADVLETNFYGVRNFVDAIFSHRPLRQPLTLVCASSTSIIVGNPNCLGYNLSKVALHAMFKALDRRHHHDPPGLRFKSLVLGPIRTNIFTSGSSFGLQREVRDWLTVDVDEAVPVIARFLEGQRQALYYPKRAVWTMRALKAAMKVWPGVYRG